MKIPTKDRAGNQNGWLIPVWNSLGSDYKPAQVYVTAVLPGMRKGPHLHKKRAGRFCCISGNCDIVMQSDDGLYHRIKDMGLTHQAVHACAGTPLEIICTSTEPAILINMPMPAWSTDDPDEWPVENWEPNV